ncbi:hypothetical protein CIL05_03180 [Virgibacillus profundi]|uniref:Uncharacterized protein n=2 Tax=Virgibacillus profundi TaxID=2024555 RepID=A0A2A2IIB6_9BACI|nr:hypothetical protein CIL05_03180 [Virgibacillus profundi]PXY55232.1 hypothetical protein CIT14_03255 [Virgibacillus profundi]
MDDDVKAFCQRYMNYHVVAQMNDGSEFNGIIESMDDDGVTMYIPEEIDADQMRPANEEGAARQFDFDFDDYDEYGRPRRRRFRRFRRRRFPFRLFRRLFLFPYYYPYYPYYPWY